jgi:hypothetical protein
MVRSSSGLILDRLWSRWRFINAATGWAASFMELAKSIYGKSRSLGNEQVVVQKFGGKGARSLSRSLFAPLTFPLSAP